MSFYDKECPHIKDIRLTISIPRVQSFKVTQGHHIVDIFNRLCTTHQGAVLELQKC